MGDFNCQTPADGTPLLTCCPAPPGQLTRCGNLVTKAVVYEQPFWLHSPSCTMYLRMDSTVSTYLSTPTLNRIDTRHYGWKTAQFTSSSSFTSVIPLQEDQINCGNLPFVQRTNESCSTTVDSFRIQCYSPTFPPGPGFDYSTTYSQSFTRQDMLGPLNELLTWAAQNFDSAPAVIGFRPGGEIGAAQFSAGMPECGTDPLNGLDWDETYGAFGGLENTIKVGEFIGYAASSTPLGAAIPSQSQCFRFGVIRWVAWFSKVTLTENYQIETFAVRSLQSPPTCSQLAPMNAESTNVCDLLTTQQFSDGLNDNGGQRVTLFGPRDYTPHYTRTLCRA